MRWLRSSEEGLAVGLIIAIFAFYVFVAINTRMWVTRTDVLTIHDRWSSGRLGMNGDQPLFAAMHAESNVAVARLATAVDAVVVPAGYLTPDHDGISRAYQERLISGYRYALMSGAPLLVLSGAAETCELAMHFLLTSPRVLPRLFTRYWLQSMPEPLNTTAATLRDALRHTLADPYDVQNEEEEISSDQTNESSQTKHTHTLGQLLRITRVHSDFHRFSTHAVRHIVPPIVLDGTLAHRAQTDAETALLAALHRHRRRQRHEAQQQDRQRGERPFDRTSDRITLYGAVPEVDGEALGNTWSNSQPANSLTAPHVLTYRGRDYVLPGLLIAENDADDETEDAVATALYRWMQRTAVGHAVGQASSPPKDLQTGVAQAIRWLNSSRHAVVVVSASSEQQYIKLLYRQALRKSGHALQSGFRRAQRELRRADLREARRTTVKSASSNAAGTSATEVTSTAERVALDELRLHFEVLVVPPLVEHVEIPRLDPVLLPYTGLLPEDAPADACRLARWLGTYGHYINDNYRRIAEGVMGRVASAAQVDEVQLLLNMLRKASTRRLSFTDVIRR